MKKILFFFAMLASVTASAQRTTPVTIANTKVDYSTKIVTFDLSWKGSDASHRNEVWVLVDIQPITGTNTLGSWSPATLVPNSTTVTAGSGNQYSSLTHIVVSGNTRGVWVKGTATNTTSTFAATVNITLNSGTPAKFNACAYATDYPPNAASYSGGTYTLKGTKPFIVNGTTVYNNQYAVTTITSLTDATGCPGGVGRDVEHNNGSCAPGLTPCGGYCRDLTADKAFCYNTYDIEVQLQSGSQCVGDWRWPTAAEAKSLVSAGFYEQHTSNNGATRIRCVKTSNQCAWCTYVFGTSCFTNNAVTCYSTCTFWQILSCPDCYNRCVR
jgi:archaellum component FlaF (FlaF/FlaG flagellin family)